jgi:copper chaperone CopZ
MKKFRPLTIPLFAAGALTAAEQTPLAPAAPHPTTQTYYISNVSSDKDAASITESLQKVKSVTKVESLTPKSGYANISFDSHVVSYHQVAQAIMDAEPQNGKKHEVTMKVRVPDYTKDDNATKVDEVFAKQKSDVRVECVDKEKGEFVMHFLPLKTDPSKNGPQGFNGGKFGHPIHDPAPKGLGLAFSIVREGAPKAPAKQP